MDQISKRRGYWNDWSMKLKKDNRREEKKSKQELSRMS